MFLVESFQLQEETVLNSLVPNVLGRAQTESSRSNSIRRY
jgi:hypothetical protein